MSQGDEISVDFEQGFKDELETINTKRKVFNSVESSENPTNFFSIALSGGGIYSATSK